jgi:hypothetical protein
MIMDGVSGLKGGEVVGNHSSWGAKYSLGSQKIDFPKLAALY